MREPLVIGILAEIKNRWERRAPLTPQDVKWLIRRKIRVEVKPSSLRIFKDREYQKVGAKIVQNFQKSKLILGIKEPKVESLKRGTVHLVFSHTSKGQKQNRNLLKAFLHKKITLIDFEHITDRSGERLAYFGRFAGICGMIDSLHCFGKRLSLQGTTTPLLGIKHSTLYSSYEKAIRDLKKLSRKIKQRGLGPSLSPLIIGITGQGNVSKGAQEVLEILNPVEIHPRDMLHLLQKKQKLLNPLYKIVFEREQKLRAKTGRRFYYEEYLNHPERFESNLDLFLPHLNMLIHCSYWDRHYPRLVTEKMISKLSKQKGFKLSFIGDLSCDLKGSIEITTQISSPDQPAYVYNPRTRKIKQDLGQPGIAILAVDNLPCEFPP